MDKYSLLYILHIVEDTVSRKIYTRMNDEWTQVHIQQSTQGIEAVALYLGWGYLSFHKHRQTCTEMFTYGFCVMSQLINKMLIVFDTERVYWALFKCAPWQTRICPLKSIFSNFLIINNQLLCMQATSRKTTVLRSNCNKNVLPEGKSPFFVPANRKKFNWNALLVKVSK